MQEANCLVRNLAREVILKIHGFVVRGVAVKRGQVGVVETRERWSMRHTFHSLFHSRLKTFLFLQILPTAAFPFLLQD